MGPGTCPRCARGATGVVAKRHEMTQLSRRADTVVPVSSENQVNPDDIVWMNSAEASKRLGITVRTLYRFIDDGELPAYRFGRVIRLKANEVDKFIEACRIEPGTLDSAPPRAEELAD
jgi:excisionase family DNA binding protein